MQDMLTKDSAICIRTTDYSETSQIVTFFTKANGKISAIAKGSKRPKSSFEGPIEIFSHGTIVFSDSKKEKLATLTEFQQQIGFESFAANLFALNCASFAAELVNKLTNEFDPHPGLFDSFLNFLKNTSQTSGKNNTILLLILFQLSLLKEVGFKPILNACANCKRIFSAGWSETYFSHLSNGLICKDCEDSFPDQIRLTRNTAACLADLKLTANANERALNEIERLLIDHFTEILHHRPKMAKYILK
jgi:DNA repair protein RecO (recombination protein O)